MLPARDDHTLGDDDVARELEIAHSRRHEVFLAGTADAWENLCERTQDLEAEFLRRFADRTVDADLKSATVRARRRLTLDPETRAGMEAGTP